MQLKKISIVFYSSIELLYDALRSFLISNKYLWIVDQGFSQKSLAGFLFKQKIQAPLIDVAGGESVKSWHFLETIFDKLQEMDPGIEGIVAVGGGATLDLAALAAHLYRRGISLVHIPTTLLAMVDASLGGKCAVNWKHMKNRVGAYHFPDAIFSSIELLGPDPNHLVILEGLSEVYKHALLASGELKQAYLSFLKTKELSYLIKLIPLAASIKEKVIKFDKIKNYEGVRHLLNLGHTVAHGLEAAFATSENPISHGKAVALGLLIESYLLRKDWEEPSFCHVELRKDLSELIGSWPQMDESQWNRFFEAMKLDKKGSGEEIALSKFGKCFEMIQPQSSYLTYCKPQEIIDAWRACECSMASDLRDQQHC